MLHILSRSYSPEAIAAMTAAYDRVRQSLSARINGNEDVMQSLALIILRHVDQGESDPVRLSDVASANWQALTVRQTGTVRQRDDYQLGQRGGGTGLLSVTRLAPGRAGTGGVRASFCPDHR
jgi:hypothetical protein